MHEAAPDPRNAFGSTATPPVPALRPPSSWPGTRDPKSAFMRVILGRPVARQHHASAGRAAEEDQSMSFTSEPIPTFPSRLHPSSRPSLFRSSPFVPGLTPPPSALRPPPFFPALRSVCPPRPRTQVYGCWKNLESYHFFSLFLTRKTPIRPAIGLRKSFLGNDIRSGPRRFADEKRVVGSMSRKRPDNSLRCSLSPELSHVRRGSRASQTQKEWRHGRHRGATVTPL